MLILTFIVSFLGGLKVPPLGAHQATQLPEGEVWVSSFDDGPHLTAEQDVATHVDLPLGPFLLRHALYLRSGLQWKTEMQVKKQFVFHHDNMGLCCLWVGVVWIPEGCMAGHPYHLLEGFASEA